MSIIEQTVEEAVPTTVDAPPPLPTPSPQGDRGITISRRAGFAVAGGTYLHQQFLFMTSASTEGMEIAGYVTATTLLAVVAQFALIGAALGRASFLPRALGAMMAIGLIAQAACPIDGHVSVTNTGFMLQTISWLGYGIAAVAVLARGQMRTDQELAAS